MGGRALSGVAGLSLVREVERGGFVGVVAAGVDGAVSAGAVVRGVSAGVPGPVVGRGGAVVEADVVVAGVFTGAAVSGPRSRLDVDCSGGGSAGRFRLEVG